MSKKALPKTPESLFDPIGGSSRSSSPTPQRPKSRTPTKRFTPLNQRKNQNLSWYEKFLIHNITFYTFLILSLLLVLTITRNLVPVNYCDDKDNIVDCIPCPKYANCSGTRFDCLEGSFLYKDMCIKKNSDQEKVIDHIPTIEHLIENGTSTVEGIIKQLNGFIDQKNLTITKDLIEVAVHLSGKYVVNGGQIDTPLSRQMINLSLYIALTLCLIIFSLSVFFRIRN